MSSGLSITKLQSESLGSSCIDGQVLIAHGVWRLASVPRPQEKSHLTSGYPTRSLSKEFSSCAAVLAAVLAFPCGDVQGASPLLTV